MKSTPTNSRSMSSENLSNKLHAFVRLVPPLKIKSDKLFSIEDARAQSKKLIQKWASEK